jgi:electron transfer flavoprotein beta subunit
VTVKIGVLLKQVPDTESKIRPTGDGSGIETGDIKWIVSPYDEFAVEQAIQIKEKEGGEVVIISLSPTNLDACRTALAMGADRAVVLDDDGFAGSDAYGTARALAAVIEKEELELVFAGRQAIDRDQNAVPQVVATLLEWRCATWINGFELDGDSATVKRPVGGGETEVVKVSLPAVFTCTKGLNEPRYASLPGIMKAKRKPVANYTPADLDLDGEVGADAAVVSLGDFELPPGRPAGRILDGELGDQVKELVKLLREEAKVI